MSVHINRQRRDSALRKAVAQFGVILFKFTRAVANDHRWKGAAALRKKQSASQLFV
jgi:hypothetical protein